MPSEQALRNAALDAANRAGAKAGRQAVRAMGQTARALDKARRGSKSSGGSKRTFVKMPRVRKAPASASQFRLERKYSSRTGGKNGKNPTSAVEKIKYDHGLDEQGDERILYTCVAAKPGTPAGALDPIAVAQEAEHTAGRQINSRQMAHDTISLPKELSPDGQKALAERIAQEISRTMDGVPVFAALHEEPDENGNLHLHVSNPLRSIIPDESMPHGFRMGQRVAFEQRPQWRADHGLEKTNHKDFIALRSRIAGLCADALEKEGAGKHLVGRWRHGAKRLNVGTDTQIMAAKKRGDTVFVQENEFREVQRHEGPGHRRTGGETPSQAHNADLSAVSPAIIAERVLREAIEHAQQQGAQDWEAFRQIAADHGLSVHYNRQRSGKTKGQVTGLQYEIAGFKFAGKEVGGMSLAQLKKELLKHGCEFASASPAYAPTPVVTKDGHAARIKALEALFQGQAQPAPAARPKAAQVVAQPRPPVSPRPKAQAVKQEKPMDIQKMMSELSQIPEPVAQKKPQQPRPQKTIVLAKLEPWEKMWLRNNASNLPYQLSDFDQKINSAREKLSRLEDSEPAEKIGRIFRRENPEHIQWAVDIKTARKILAQLEESSEAWATQHFYDKPESRSLLAGFKEQRVAQAKANVLLAYQQAEAMMPNEASRRQGAMQMKRLEQQYPGVIGPYKAEKQAQEEAEKQAQAEANRNRNTGGQKSVFQKQR